MIHGQPLTSLKITGRNQEQSQLSHIKNLKPGQIVDAKVLDVKLENRVLLLLSGTSETAASGPGNVIRDHTQQMPGERKTAASISQIPANESGKPLLAGQKVEVSTPLPLKTGMSLTLTAVATRKGPVLKPTPSTTLSSAHTLSLSGTDAALKILPGQQKSSVLLPAGIKPGQTVDAKIIDVTPQNKCQLLIGGQKLTVSTQLPLARGMNIPMKVVRSQDGILLKPVSPPSGPVSTDMPNTVVNTGRQVSPIPAALPDSNPLPGTKESFQTTDLKSFSLGKIFQGLSALSQTREPVLNDILMGLSLKSDVRNDQFFPQIIKNMGLSFEKKLATGLQDTPDKKTVAHVIKQLAGQDLKAASLSLAGMETDPGKASVLKNISDALDNFAQLNVKSADSGQSQDSARFLLPFPVWREDGFDFGQLMVDTGKTGTADTKKRVLSISFLLNMTVLGPFRADFSILDKTITGRFLLEKQATCDYLAPKISNLRQRLSGIGYQAGNIECQVARPEQIAPTSLILSMKEPDEMQGLNIVI